MKNFLYFFLRGILFIFPVFATIYILYALLGWANNLFNELLYNWLQTDIPGLGLLTAIIAITLLGFILTRSFSRPYFNLMERLLERTPLIKILYSALKDLTEAFVGDRKKFNQPVIVSLQEGVDKLGFITESDLVTLGIENRVAVYCPHSYNFSGNLFLVDPTKVQILKINPTDAMKFIVSAGITKIEKHP